MPERKVFPGKLLIYSIIDKHCSDVILKNRFVVTDPTKGFNDPLDCYFELKFTGLNKEDLIENLMGLFILEKGKKTSELTNEERDEIKNKTHELEKSSKDILQQQLSENSIKRIREHFSKSYRMRCFSALDAKKTLNNVMFSHYGNSHKGLCYIFNQEKLFSIKERQFLMEVNYCCKPASIEHKTDYSNDEWGKIGRDMFRIKHEDWKYEKEWRVIVNTEFPNEIHETMEFPSNALVTFKSYGTDEFQS